jgi:hypothetical protein
MLTAVRESGKPSAFVLNQVQARSTRLYAAFVVSFYPECRRLFATPSRTRFGRCTPSIADNSGSHATTIAVS